MGLLLNVIRNKKNNQLLISLPRKKLGLKKDTIPKQIIIEKMKIHLEKIIQEKKKNKRLFE